MNDTRQLVGNTAPALKCPVECETDKGYHGVLTNKLDREECLDVHQQTPEETTAARCL